MSNINIETKAIAAASRYLEYRDYEVITTEQPYPLQIVAREDDSIVFVSVNITFDSFDCAEASRSDFELAAASYLKEHSNEFPDITEIRFDSITMLVLADSKAMVRHEVNVLNR